MANKVLVLYAHPSQNRSEVNQPLFEAARRIEGVTCVDLYAEYPTYHINIEREQQRLLRHDVIVFLFPLYWYSTPSILKEWQDLVLEYGFAYGKEGTALRGKLFFCALSTGGEEHAYKREGFNHFTVSELLQPLEQTANLTGMIYLPPMVLFGARTAVEDQRLAEHVARWERLLKAFVSEQVDITAARQEILMNPLAELLTKELGERS
ncbi:NAD(P)H-dependent oxidoreductase [Parendozoicomonas haliclonae]|uniref:General stress protein 14 n=1 Tax=Parendozoicomonas haliclonae TaxID=1960125 RepID=A0A1X7AMB0_9GAMM|nr:NAD(P)H-dependent oxidoreductase [Parendozoicomonas haliclonae]SMA49097.1 General stress protein 14 [Parendozoicomonas haliclonae]